MLCFNNNFFEFNFKITFTNGKDSSYISNNINIIPF